MQRNDDHSVVWVRVPLDEETAARLRNLSDICHADPVSVAASLLHDILKDDADAHHLIVAEPPSPSIN
ncbi:hypothetical protein [Bradyrhizobium sp.]